ncbi:MAG: TetR/AcrR family transcriptional regulator [Deltaproteobacteria bacterium]|nr:TetR/AcrR family transcriptional regulator [Deltaproteobacteria bacterium]
MDNREKIILSAIEVFGERGLYGARMEEIAKRCKLNKAMLYYYFNSKDNLFMETLVWIVQGIFGEMYTREIHAFENSSYTPLEKIKAFISIQLDTFSSRIEYAKLFNFALGHEPDRVREAVITALDRRGLRGPELIYEIFDEGVKDGIFRSFDYSHALINIIGMTLIHVIAVPISEIIIGKKVADEQKFIEERRTSIIDLVFKGILA